MEHGFKSLMCFSKRGPVSRAPLPAYVTKEGNIKKLLAGIQYSVAQLTVSSRHHAVCSLKQSHSLITTVSELLLSSRLRGVMNPLPGAGPSMEPQLLFLLLQERGGAGRWFRKRQVFLHWINKGSKIRLQTHSKLINNQLYIFRNITGYQKEGA